MSVALDLDLLAEPATPVPARPRLRLVAGGGAAAPAVAAGPGPRRTDVPAERSGPAAPVAVLLPPSGAFSAAPLRLTRRGVVVLGALVAALAGALLWAAAASAGGASSPATSGRVAPVPASVTVRAGDTVWSIAGRVAPGRDPRTEVADLRRLNHLTDPQITPGQVLRVR